MHILTWKETGNNANDIWDDSKEDVIQEKGFYRDVWWVPTNKRTICEGNQDGLISFTALYKMIQQVRLSVTLLYAARTRNNIWIS